MSMFSFTRLTITWLCLWTFIDNMTKFITTKANYFLWAFIYRMLKRQAINTKKLLWALIIEVTNFFTSEASHI